MPKKTTKSKKTVAKENFLNQPAGYFVSAVVLLIVAYVLASLAIDSGSILQWFGTIVALGWGIGRFVQGLGRLLKKHHGNKR